MKLRAIIADDDTDEVVFMKEGFEDSGYFEIIAVAENGDELLGLLNSSSEENLPDLIFSDLNMHGKSGYDLLREMKASERYSNIPVVVMSTSSNSYVKAECERLGAAHFLPKPETFDRYGELAGGIFEKFRKAGS